MFITIFLQYDAKVLPFMNKMQEVLRPGKCPRALLGSDFQLHLSLATCNCSIWPLCTSNQGLSRCYTSAEHIHLVSLPWLCFLTLQIIKYNFPISVLAMPYIYLQCILVLYNALLYQSYMPMAFSYMYSLSGFCFCLAVTFNSSVPAVAQFCKYCEMRQLDSQHRNADS